MTTIAQLGFEINSQSAVQAADDLDKLVDSGKGAEDSAKRVESAWQKAVSGISSDTSQIVKELQQLNARQDTTAQLMAKLAQSVNQASAAFTSASAAAEKTATAEAKVAETADQAKARMLALANAAIEAAKSQQQLSGSLDSTAAAAGEAARKQLDQLAAQNRAVRAAADAALAQDKAANSTKQAATATAEDANALAKLIGQIDPTVAALKRLDAQQDLLGKSNELGLLSKEDFNRYNTAINQTREGLTKFQGDLNKTGVSAKQNAAALRMLPAQFSDIAVSLASGQQPFTVFLQQGSQIKDSFGGAGAAVQAMGGYLASLISPLTVGAAAVGALAAVYIDAEREVSAFNKALFSGTASSGQTASSLSAISQTVSAITGDISEAKAAVIALAGSANLSTTQFINLAQAAGSISEYTGSSAADVAKALSDVGTNATKAAEKISEKYGLVTSAQYEVIAALDEQGKKQEALDALSGFLNENAQKRLAQYKASLSDVERDWNNIGTAISNAYSKVKAELFPDLQKEKELIERVIKTREDGGVLGSLSTGLGKASSAFDSMLGLKDRDSTQALKDRLALINQQLAATQQLSTAQGAEGNADQTRIEYLKQWDAKHKSNLFDQAKLEDDIKDLRLLGLNAGKSQIEIDKEVANLRSKYDKAHPAKAVPVDLTGFNDAENALKSLDAAYQNSVRVLDASLKSGLITQEQYSSQKAALISKEKTDVEAAYNSEIAALQAVRDKASTTGAQRIGIDQKIADARQKQTDALKKLDTDQDVLSKQTKGRLEQEEAAYKAFAQTVSDSLALAQRGLDQQLAGYSLGDRARQQLQQDLQIREDYQRKLEQLTRDYQKIINPTDGQKSNFDRETQLLQSALDERLAKQQKYYQDEAALRSDWMNGASRAFANYIDETNDVAGQTEGLFSDALHGVEDAFVNAATTGKLSFKSLADSIIADLTRIVAKAYVVTPILAALGIGGDPASGAGSAGGLGSLFGGGTSGGLGGTLSNISTVVSAAGSKFGQSVLAGWNGGEGVVGGLEGAFSNGADYFKSVVTSAFETGSTTAASIFSSETASAALSQGYSNYAAQFGTGVAGQGAFDGALTASTVQTSALSGLQTLSATLGYIQGVYTIFSSFKDYGLKGGAVTAGAGAAGAYIGSFAGPLGTAAGFAIGTVLGSLGAGKLFGGSGEMYPDLSTSAQGTYKGGQYNTQGIVQGWQTNAPKFGTSVDAQLDSTVNKFAKTLGDLYTAFGASTQVYAYDMLQVRKTSGKYSTTFGATIDGGGANDLNIHQQFSAADAAEALQHNYDDIMGTFLAKAIVSSKSLPDYFRAQFTEFANDWDTTADQVIKAIEGIFTRFNGVNDALSLIGVNNLKLDDTGLAASDSILNMIGAMNGLDTATASAKDKVDSLNKAVSTYYQAFFSADEQFADLTKNLQGALGNLGVSLPDTRAAYRQMVEDIDVTTAAGQAMFATLVGLATNADSYYSTLDQKAKDAQQAAAEAAQKIIDGLMGNVTSTQSALERAINAQKASINDMLQTANTSVSNLTGVSNDLGSALKSLRGESGSAVQMLRAQAQATLQSALAQARAGKSLAGFTGLSDALDTISNNSTDLYSSLEDFNRDQGRTANVVAELEKLNGKQLTNAEQTVKTLQSQLDALDDQLEFAQQQLDALNGVDNSVKTVAQAVKEMNIAVVAALSAITGKASGGTATNNATLIDSVYQSVLGHGADQAGKDYWLGQLASGAISYSQLEQAIKNAALANGSLQAHANGGYISGPGTGTSDSILARLSNGEYVMKAAAVDTYGTDLLNRMNNLQMPKFASGGAVMNVASPVVAANPQRAQSGNDAGEAAEVIRQLNKRLSNIETYMDSASRDLRQINNAGVQVVGTVSTKEVA
ncbi:phage tail tape measure protein [Pseudomonas abietaniphila]|uniref:phage tail tape measure protein n=1 Tax=Pseudomonas abietaniphila TaxID=89065 RepID=UPI0007866F4E|nr:phage tail tape measure protein [Pseudomonas abietaniphila]